MPTKKRSNPDHDSPSKAKDKKSKQEPCAICDELINDADDGDDSIFCDGSCQGWLHRQCAGLSKKRFQIIGESSDPFYCPHCMLHRQACEIKDLKETISLLTSRIESLNPCLSDDQQHKPPPQKEQSSTSAQPSRSDNSNSLDRKFNVVIYGINECPRATPRATRINSDVKSCAEILRQANDDISHHSIRDCLRLGKFNSSSTRPRPILVKLARAIDATMVLYNRSRVSDGIKIKPDMSREEKQLEAILLSERWNLICSGTDKKDIKIYGSKLFVKGQKYGEVINSAFQLSTIPNATTKSSSAMESDTPTVPNTSK